MNSYIVNRCEQSELNMYILLYDYYLNYFKKNNEKYANFAPEFCKNYDFRTGVDSVFLLPSDFFPPSNLRHQFPNSVEDAVRSVKHARQYLEEGVYVRFLYRLLFFTLFLPLFLFLLPLVSLRHIMVVLMIAVLGWVILSMDWVKLSKFIESDFEKGYWVNVVSFTILPFTGVLLIIYSTLSKKRFQFVQFAIALLFIGLFLTLFPTLGIMQQNFKNVGLPYNHAFFGVQVLGLAGAFLLTYTQSLPKKA